MDICEEAITAHISWKEQLRQLAEQGSTDISPDQIADYHICELGRWIMGEGVEYQGFASFDTLASCHQEFHRYARCVAEALVAGDFQLAETLLLSDGELNRASTDTVLAIGQLRSEIEMMRFSPE